MNSLSIIKKAQGYYMPDDPDQDQDEPESEESSGEDGKYQELLDLARQVSDEGLSSELVLLAQLYKRSLEIGGGYSTINKSIHNLMNMYLEDEDDPQQEAVESVLNEIVTDLRERAGGAGALSKPDSPEVMKQLKQLKDAYNAQTLQEDFYNMELPAQPAGKGKPVEVAPGQVFDMTGGVGKDESGKGPGTGISPGGSWLRKDWVASYENERLRYIDLLASVQSVAAKERIQKLIEILTALKHKTIEEKNLNVALVNTGDPETKDQLDKLKQEISKLKGARNALKMNIKKHELSNTISNLKETLNNTGDERDQERLKQEISLYELLKSDDVGKSEEIRLRKTLINAMSGGNWIEGETKAKWEEKIQEAARKKKSITALRVEQADKIKQQFEYSGKRRLQALSLEGLTTQFKQSLPSIKMGIKKKITERLKREKLDKFSAYRERVVAALQSGDKEALAEAVKEEAKALNREADSAPEVMRFAAYGESFYNYLRDLKELQRAEAAGETPPISAQYLLTMGEDLLAQEQNRRSGIAKGPREYSNLEAALMEILNQLKERVGSIEKRESIFNRYIKLSNYNKWNLTL